jgi:hypothetical protein
MKLEPVTPEPVTPECPRAVERPIMLQGWHDLASVHWPSFGRWSTFPIRESSRVGRCRASALGDPPFKLAVLRRHSAHCDGTAQSNRRAGCAVVARRRGSYRAAPPTIEFAPAVGSVARQLLFRIFTCNSIGHRKCRKLSRRSEFIQWLQRTAPSRSRLMES